MDSASSNDALNDNNGSLLLKTDSDGPHSPLAFGVFLSELRAIGRHKAHATNVTLSHEQSHYDLS